MQRLALFNLCFMQKNQNMFKECRTKFSEKSASHNTVISMVYNKLQNTGNVTNILEKVYVDASAYNCMHLDEYVDVLYILNGISNLAMRDRYENIVDTVYFYKKELYDEWYDID